MTRKDAIESLVNDFDDYNTIEEYFEYLDWLRDSGQTNMFGATPYLSEEFKINKTRANEILNLWMNSFGR